MKTKATRIITILLLISIIITGSITTSFAATRLKTTDLRYSGQTAYDTSLAVAAQLYKERGAFDNVIIATGITFPDALSGGYLAKVKGSPIILVCPEYESRVTSAIQKYMKPTGTVYILGGGAVVRRSYENELKNKGFRTKRLAGQSAIDTNLEILKHCASKTDSLLIVSNRTFQDALSGSSTGIPLMVVNGTLRSDQVAYIKNAGVKNFYILGGRAVVPLTMEGELKNLGGKVERLGGSKAEDTSKKIAERFFPNANIITMATSFRYEDGLSGAPLAMQNKSPILLVSTDYWMPAHKYVVERRILKDITIGGGAVVKTQTVLNVMEQYGEEPAHTHTYGNPTWSWTGVTTAKATFKCTSNDDTKVVNATITSKVTKEATETAEGSKTYTAKATFNGKTYTNEKTETIPKKEHTTHTWNVAWTYEIKTATMDGVVDKGEEYVNSATATFTCKSCTEKKVVTTSTGGFNSDANNNYFTFSVKGPDGKEYSAKKALPRKGHTHSYSTAWKTDKTYHWHECKANDGAVKDKAKHTFGSWTTTKKATETAEGLKERTCTVCKYKETQAIPKVAHTHTYDTAWKSDNTNHWHECKSGDGAVSGKAAHTWDSGKVTTASTETKTGVKTYTCTVCKKTKTETIPKLNHTHSYGSAWKSDSTSHWHECTANDGAVSGKAAHTWDGGKITKAATCGADGVKTYTCTICKKTKTETIPMLGHKWGDWKPYNETQHVRECANDSTHKEYLRHLWNRISSDASGDTHECVHCGVTRKDNHVHNYNLNKRVIPRTYGVNNKGERVVKKGGWTETYCSCGAKQKSDFTYDLMVLNQKTLITGCDIMLRLVTEDDTHAFLTFTANGPLNYKKRYIDLGEKENPMEFITAVTFNTPGEQIIELTGTNDVWGEREILAKWSLEVADYKKLENAWRDKIWAKGKTDKEKLDILVDHLENSGDFWYVPWQSSDKASSAVIYPLSLSGPWSEGTNVGICNDYASFVCFAAEQLGLKADMRREGETWHFVANVTFKDGSMVTYDVMGHAAEFYPYEIPVQSPLELSSKPLPYTTESLVPSSEARSLNFHYGDGELYK